MKHILIDHCLVKVEKKYEDEIEVNGTTILRNIGKSEVTGGLIEPKTQQEIIYLRKKLLNFQRKPERYKEEIKCIKQELDAIWNYDTEIVGSYNANEDLRIFGTVVAPPTSLSDRMLYMDYEGEPYHQRGVDHDLIKRSFGHIKRRQYFPTHWECSGFKMNDLKIGIREGDKVYFHYLSTKDDNEVSRETVDGKEVVTYKVPYEQIFARFTGGTVVPINGFVVCEYEFEDNVSKYGVILSADKKPKYLVAKVKYANPDSVLSAGDIIYYTPNADFENMIEGEMVLVMDERYVLAKVD